MAVGSGSNARGAAREISGDSGNNKLNGSNQSETFLPGRGNDIIKTGGGRDVVSGSSAELHRDKIIDFNSDDAVLVEVARFDASDMRVDSKGNYTYLRLNTDGKGSFDSSVRLTGKLGSDFDVTNIGADTLITLGGGGSAPASTPAPAKSAPKQSAPTSGSSAQETGNGKSIKGTAGNNKLKGGNGDETFTPGLGKDTITTGGGKDVIAGTAKELNRDRVTDFDGNDRILVKGAKMSAGDVDIDVKGNYTYFRINADWKGGVDASVRINGRHKGDAEVKVSGNDTYVSLGSGGGGGNNVAASKPQPSQPAKKSSGGGGPSGKFEIVVFGDSLVDESRKAIKAKDAFAQQLENKLKGLGYNVDVVDQATSGHTSRDGKKVVDRYLSKNDAPEVAIVEYGTNDARRKMLGETEDNLDYIIKKLSSQGTKVVLAGSEGSFPHLNQGHKGSNVQKFEKIFKNLAAKYKIPLFEDFLKGVDDTAQQRAKYTFDELHPNPAGVKVIVNKILPDVKTAINKVGGKALSADLIDDGQSLFASGQGASTSNGSGSNLSVEQLVITPNETV
ncbi:MAG: GDSL-type esterase/lipase family protein [Geminicoccaceae bacterium]